MSAGCRQLRIGYVLRSYPRLSQTFILNEVLALEQLGLKIHIFAVTDPREPVVQARVAEVQAPVDYLDAALKRPRPAIAVEQLRVALAWPRRYFRTARYVLTRPDLDAGYAASSRYTCFLHAVHLAQSLRCEMRRTGRTLDHLHAHFAHDPALIALLTHMLTGISYSFTTHARDLYQISTSALADRIEAASAVITICAANVDYLNRVAPAQSSLKVRLIHHGADLQAFQPTPHRLGPQEFPLILSASRFVEKKGYPDLLRACGRLKQAGYRFRCAIYGDGPLWDELAALIKQLELEGEVKLAGARAQRELVPEFQRAAIFALTPFVTADGDRDGVPTVLIEAMACGVPVVSTAVAGIPELITHEHDGLLVEPHDVEAMASALATLLDDEHKRKRLGVAARHTVETGFDTRAGAQQIAAMFQAVTAREPHLPFGGHPRWR